MSSPLTSLDRFRVVEGRDGHMFRSAYGAMTMPAPLGPWLAAGPAFRGCFETRYERRGPTKAAL
jgi:hypothetical protein